MPKLAKVSILLLLCFASLVSLAQEVCPDIVLDAIERMENACVAVGRNQAC